MSFHSTSNSNVKNDAAIEVITEDFHNLQTTTEEEEEVQLNTAESEEVNLAAQTADMEEAKEEFISVSHNIRSKTPSNADSVEGAKKPSTFQLSKQHTGMKNISFGVGNAVTPTNKMEFNPREDFGVVKIHRPVSKLGSPPAPDNSDAISTVSSGEGLTDQGYYDLKFFHNKLW